MRPNWAPSLYGRLGFDKRSSGGPARQPGAGARFRPWPFLVRARVYVFAKSLWPWHLERDDRYSFDFGITQS